MRERDRERSRERACVWVGEWPDRDSARPSDMNERQNWRVNWMMWKLLSVRLCHVSWTGRLRSVDICDWSMDGLNWLPRGGWSVFDDWKMWITTPSSSAVSTTDGQTPTSRTEQQTHTHSHTHTHTHIHTFTRTLTYIHTSLMPHKRSSAWMKIVDLLNHRASMFDETREETRLR